MQAFFGLALVYLAAAARAIREPLHEGHLSPKQLQLDGLLPAPLLVYYINTDSQTARRVNMEQQARQLKLPLRRFRATDLDDIASGRLDATYITPQGLDSDLLKSGPDRSINGTVACFVSHTRLLEQIAANFSSERVALILEDDVLMPTDLLARLQHVLQCAPPDWSLLKVSSWGTVREANFVRPSRTSWQAARFQLHSLLSMLDFEGRVALDQQCPDVYEMRGPFTQPPPFLRSWVQSYPDYYYAGTGAYVVQVSKIPAVLQHLRSQPITDVDHMMLLAEGGQWPGEDYSPYQIWPFVVQLSWRHWISSVLPPAQVNRRWAVASLFLVLILASVAVLAFCLLRGLVRLWAAAKGSKQ